MVFSSTTFLFCFLPAVLALYQLLFLPVTWGFRGNLFRKLANAWLFVASLVFYFWGEKYLVGLLLFSSLVDYAGGWLISGARWTGPIEILPRDQPRTGWQKFWLGASLSVNLGLLGYYKYSGFLAENLNHLYAMLGVPEIPVFYNALPLGISFYTFQTMSYSIDVYRGQVRATRNLLDFGAFVTMFPQLVAGPIVRYCDVAADLEQRTITRSKFALGIERLVLGLGKKLLIANSVALVAEEAFRVDLAQGLGWGAAWLGLLAYALQIYFDFSGYSDMAIGMGWMLGFHFPENFNYPYSARSVREFWHRWHITLSTWFRDYVYIPLGGSRESAARTRVNLLLVFLLCGFWHGASWNFVVWGLFHGLFLSLERWGQVSLLHRYRLFSHIYTLLVVLCGWVFFRAESLHHVALYLWALVGGNAGKIESLAASALCQRIDVLLALVAGCLFSFPLVPALRTFLEKWSCAGAARPSPARQALLEGMRLGSLFLVFLISSASLAARTHNPFLYFRF